MTHPMIVKDAKELAGQFFEKNRTVKFRATWRSDRQFVDACWPRFVQAVRAAYADLLKQDRVNQNDKDAMFRALIADVAEGSQSPHATEPLQLAPNTQAFEGDKGEHRHTIENFGREPDRRVTMTRDYLKRTTALQ